MPTGYTAIIEDKPDVTFEEFCLRCARAFGATIHQRDTALENKPTPPPRDDVDRATWRLGTLIGDLGIALAKTRQDWEREAKLAYLEALASHSKALSEESDTVAAYSRMTAEVEAWVPPSKDHESLKQFMLEQLSTGAPSTYYSTHPPTEKSWNELRDLKFSMLCEQIKSAALDATRSASSIMDKTEWVEALYASLRPAHGAKAE
jgi:hypothetical protein